MYTALLCITLAHLVATVTVSGIYGGPIVSEWYRCVPVSADSVSAVSVICGLPWPEKNLKIKEINCS
jgi:hypothetical protein